MDGKALYRARINDMWPWVDPASRTQRDGLTNIVRYRNIIVRLWEAFTTSSTVIATRDNGFESKGELECRSFLEDTKKTR